MSDEFSVPDSADDADDPTRQATVIATTDRPVPIEVREITDERVPEGMCCLGTYLDGKLVARCVAPEGAARYFERYGIFGEPRQLVLAAREEDPGLQCELYAIVPVPNRALLEDDEEEPEPWAASVPSSHYEQVVAEESGDECTGLAAVLLGSIVRFQRDRKHPDSLPLETMDVLARIVSGRVVEAVDKVLEDLLREE